jgi:hypothetical protein
MALEAQFGFNSPKGFALINPGMFSSQIIMTSAFEKALSLRN